MKTNIYLFKCIYLCIYLCNIKKNSWVPLSKVLYLVDDDRVISGFFVCWYNKSWSMAVRRASMCLLCCPAVLLCRCRCRWCDVMSRSCRMSMLMCMWCGVATKMSFWFLILDEIWPNCHPTKIWRSEGQIFSEAEFFRENSNSHNKNHNSPLKTLYFSSSGPIYLSKIANIKTSSRFWFIVKKTGKKNKKAKF